MDNTVFEAGKKLISEGDTVNYMYVIYSGKVDQEWRGVHLTLGPGTIAGLSDALNTKYDSTYTAIDDVTVFACPYKGMKTLARIFEQMPVYIFGFAKGAFRQCRAVFSIYDVKKKTADEFYDFCKGIYREYKQLCNKVGFEFRELDLMEELNPLELEGEILPWEHDYIDCLNTVENKEIENIYGKRTEIVNGVIGISCGYMQRAINCVEIMNFYLEEFSKILLSEEDMDLFVLLYELRIYAAERQIDQTEITKLINILYKYITTCDLYDLQMFNTRWEDYKKHNFDADAEAFENSKTSSQAKLDNNCFERICLYGGFEDDEIATMKAEFDAFMALNDKEGKEDFERKTRKKAVDMFYKVYEAVFFTSLDDLEIDPVIEMFLQFGFMDVAAVGMENAKALADLLGVIHENENENDHFYTIYSWLKAVINGHREPSKNELDLDYRGFVIEERKAGNITEDKVQEWMGNQTEKAKFEIGNFFKSANRTTSGKMSAFCPILTVDAFGAEPERMFLSKEKIHTAINNIEEVDFRIFLRERFYTDMDNNIKSESYLARVEPDIILLPNSGMRAMMWQECGGIKIDTPARFVFPMFTLDDLDKFAIYCCGSFRWEICRREQGARWNDIASDCLTSDFYDYFTFYKKNKDLTAENKEKVKTLLKSSRNNMREAFTKQYAIWINFEAKGSIRLNKAERNILAKHCPFSKPYRDKVSGHPMFEQSVSKYNIKTSQTLHHLNAVFGKLEKEGIEVPEEIKQGIRYLKG